MKRLSNLAKVTQPESGRARIQMQVLWLQRLCSTKSMDLTLLSLPLGLLFWAGAVSPGNLAHSGR